MIDNAGAMRRFGLGPRPGDLAAMPDIKAAILAELATRNIALAGYEQLPSTVDIMRELAAERLTQLQGLQNPPANQRVRQLPVPQRTYQAEVAARHDRAHEVTVGFVERLAAFWVNHFAIEAAAGLFERSVVGAFEREAIRPFVLGRFRDMLGAATKHPAMLSYLNNAESIGPNSSQGLATGRGLNENHARELLELHTIGVNAGYTQADVIALAETLTGWTYQARGVDAPDFGTFIFRPGTHEPGTRTITGVTYRQAGVAQGDAVLDWLASSPDTARHIAGKLARHFAIADAPALADRLAAVFIATGGDLRAVSVALVEAPEAWADPTRLISPQDYLWSTVRALGLRLEPQAMLQSLRALGHLLWDPPSPEGFDDEPDTWLAPDALTNRLDLAEQVAVRVSPRQTPVELATAILGGGLSAETYTAIYRAESESQAIALLLMSPEFQRR